MLTFKSQGSVNQTASQDNVEIIPKLTLFGHSARIWDCYVSDSVSLWHLFPLPLYMHHLAILYFLLVFLVWNDVTNSFFPWINRTFVKFPAHHFFFKKKKIRLLTVCNCALLLDGYNCWWGLYLLHLGNGWKANQNVQRTHVSWKM